MNVISVPTERQNSRIWATPHPYGLLSAPYHFRPVESAPYAEPHLFMGEFPAHTYYGSAGTDLILRPCLLQYGRDQTYGFYSPAVQKILYDGVIRGTDYSNVLLGRDMSLACGYLTLTTDLISPPPSFIAGFFEVWIACHELFRTLDPKEFGFHRDWRTPLDAHFVYYTGQYDPDWLRNE